MTKCCFSMIVMLWAAPAAAQSSDEPRPHHLQLSVGGAWLGGTALEAADANLRANAIERRDYRLFSTETRMGSVPAFEAQVGFSVTRRVVVEGEFTFARPELRTSVSADVEGAPPLTIVEGIDEYLIEASVVVQIDELRLGRRTTPFLTAGAGYIRQLHEGRTVIEHGHVFHAGGGIRHWLVVRNRGLVRAAGLRGDVRLSLLAGGLAGDGSPRPRGAVSGSFVIAF